MSETIRRTKTDTAFDGGTDVDVVVLGVGTCRRRLKGDWTLEFKSNCNGCKAHSFSLGSSASRRPSPSTLMARTDIMIATPGKKVVHGAARK